MKRGKDEEKIMGPMFPRLHVNDTDKGGPRPPPRNKMALYEQFSIPSQRFNPGVLPLNPNNTTNLVLPSSSSKGSRHERGIYFPLQLPPSIHPAENSHILYSNMNRPVAPLEQEKKLDDDDFRVPIFFHSGMGQENNKSYASVDRERHSPSSLADLGRSMKLQNASDKESKQTSITGLNLRQEARDRSEEAPKEFVAGTEQSYISALNLSSRDKTEGPFRQINPSLNYEHRDHPANNFSRSQKNDGSLHQECRADSQPDNTVHGDGVSNETIRFIDNGNSSIQIRYYQEKEQRSPNDRINDAESCEEKTCRSLQTGNMDRDDDISEASVVDSVSGVDISPDDVVGIIGQKHFWKARRAIVNQQRVFAVQVFELHRLIKVQRLIAGSPNLLLEDNAYLAKPLKDSPANKLPLDYIVKAPPNIAKKKDDSENPNHKMECSAENAVGKLSLSSVQNGSQPSNYRPFSGNAPSTAVTNDTKMGPWCFHQLPGQQWLIPVVSPSEGLVYKPYPGPGFMDPVCGGCGPGYGVPAPHHQYQGIVPPSAGHGYFPPFGMPIMDLTVSGSAVEQMNHFNGPGSHGQLSGGVANFNMQQQSSCNAPSKKNGAISNIVKLHAYKDSELQVSTASSPSERAQGAGQGHPTDGRNALPLFPTSPAVHVPDVAPHPCDVDQPTRVIKVVPHNARSATESVARIFQSIQEDRKQYDSV